MREERLCCRLIIWALLLVQMFAVAAWAEEPAVHVSSAAVVNGTVISVQDFRSELERIKRLKGNRVKTADEANLADLKREALEKLIIRELLYQESVTQKIAVDASAVDREIVQLKGQFATPGQYSENLQRINMTETMVREQVSRGLAIRILIDRSAGKDATASEEEVQKYYEQHQASFTQQSQVHLSHILIAVASEWPKYNKKEAGDRISVLRKRITDGEEFAGVAAAHSDCLSKTKGGDIGWFTPAQLTPEMEKGVSLLKVGEVSEIVEDKFGMHIIKVLERKSAVTLPLDDVREKIRSLVRQEKSLTMLQRYVKRLRDAAKVEIQLVEE
jgi:parvulin-like peptidyl-prolyl isomerase